MIHLRHSTAKRKLYSTKIQQTLTLLRLSCIFLRFQRRSQGAASTQESANLKARKNRRFSRFCKKNGFEGRESKKMPHQKDKQHCFLSERLADKLAMKKVLNIIQGVPKK